MGAEVGKHSEDILALLDGLHDNYIPYPPQKKMRLYTKGTGNSEYIGKTVALFHTNTNEVYDLGGIIGVSYAGDLGNASVTFETNEECANFFMDHLFVENGKRNIILVSHGKKRYINILRTIHVLLWMDQGYDIKILQTGTSAGMIIVKKGKSQWTLMDYEQHTARKLDDDHEYVAAIHDMQSDPLRIADMLLQHVLTIEKKIMLHFGINTAGTAASTGEHLHQRFFSPDEKMWRPRAELAYWLRDSRKSLGPVICATPYRGLGFSVDQYRAYSGALVGQLPQQMSMGNPYEDGVLCPGVYLSTITIDSPYPIYIRVYNSTDRKWNNSWHNYGTFYAIIPTCEYSGLERLGCVITPHYGWRVVKFFTLKPLLDAVANVYAIEGRYSAVSKFLKATVNSIVGKFAASPFMDEITVQEDHPGEEWSVCTEPHYPHAEIEHNWKRSVENHMVYMNIVVAAWTYSVQRNTVWHTWADFHAVGTKMVSWSTDGGIFAGNPTLPLPTESDIYGTLLLKGEDQQVVVFGSNHNIVDGVVKNAGTERYTTATTPLFLVAAPHLTSEMLTYGKPMKITAWDTLAATGTAEDPKYEPYEPHAVAKKYIHGPEHDPKYGDWPNANFAA